MFEAVAVKYGWNASDAHEKLPPLDRMLRDIVNEECVPSGDVMEGLVRQAVEDKVNGALLVKPNGDKVGQIVTP